MLAHNPRKQIGRIKDRSLIHLGQAQDELPIVIAACGGGPNRQRVLVLGLVIEDRRLGQGYHPAAVDHEEIRPGALAVGRSAQVGGNRRDDRPGRIRGRAVALGYAGGQRGAEYRLGRSRQANRSQNDEPPKETSQISSPAQKRALM